jgi:hypothetical protein
VKIYSVQTFRKERVEYINNPETIWYSSFVSILVKSNRGQNIVSGTAAPRGQLRILNADVRDPTVVAGLHRYWGSVPAVRTIGGVEVLRHCTGTEALYRPYGP